MSFYKEKNNIAKSIATDVLITFVLFFLSMLIIASLLNAGKIKIEYMKPVSMATVFIVSFIAALITSKLLNGENNKVLSLLSATILFLIMTIVFFVNKRGEGNVNSLIISAVLIYFGKFIPSVINNQEHKQKKLKHKKRKRT